MYRDIPVGNRAMYEKFMKVEKQRHRTEILQPRRVIDNTWCTPTDPTGARVKITRSQVRKDGMTHREFAEVSKQNQILLQKMGNVMKGKYLSSTKADFESSKF